MAKNKSTRVRETTGDRALHAFTTLFMLFVLVIIGYPLIYCISCSFSGATALANGRVVFLPVDFTFAGYEFVLRYDDVWMGFRNTIFYTVAHTAVAVVAQILVSYPLSKRNYQARGVFTKLMVVAMLTSAGMIPTFLLNVWLGLNNTIWAIILGGIVSISNVMILRTAFKSSIPEDLFDAAKIDGASEFRQLTTVAVPLAKATISVIMLYTAVGQWNSYFQALLYLSMKPELWPLQLVVRNIMQSAQEPEGISSAAMEALSKSSMDQVRYCLIVIVTTPLLAMYLLAQRFFEKGVMIGSVKG